MYRRQKHAFGGVWRFRASLQKAPISGRKATDREREREHNNRGRNWKSERSQAKPKRERIRFGETIRGDPTPVTTCS